MTKPMAAIWDAEISLDNKIFTAAVMAEPDDACQFLQRALGVEEQDARQIDVPENDEWMRASVEARLMMLGIWMRSAAHVLIDRCQRPVPGHRPTDFSLRTND